MQTRLLTLTFLIIVLTACVPATAIPATTPQPPASAPTSTDTPSPTARLAPPTPFPTDPPFPVITPDAVHVAHWQEYQTELARCILADGISCSYPYPKTALCEWDILGRTNQNIYVWAECRAINVAGGRPAVIHLQVDGAIQTVKVPLYGSTWYSDIKRMFPVDVQAKINLYIGDGINPGRPEELRPHLTWREEHPDEPPLIILSATPQP